MPSIGLISCMYSTRFSRSVSTVLSVFTSTPKFLYRSTISRFALISALGSLARSTISSSRLGTNSCSGGSRCGSPPAARPWFRTVPGSPSAAWAEVSPEPCAGPSRVRHDHCLHVRQTVLGEEHVLGTAQADAFGSERNGGLRIARDIGIRAHAEFTAEYVGHFMNFAKIGEFGSGSLRLRLAQPHFTGGAVHGNPVALIDRHRIRARFHRRRSSPLVDGDSAATHHARTSHAARHNGRVLSSCRPPRSRCPSPRPCRECRPEWSLCGPGSPDRPRPSRPPRPL